MFPTYLRRELVNRKRQTVIIAIGMALAIALVIVVSSIASGVKAAQASVLQSVYGVGTDITVTKTPTASANGGRPNFSFGPGSAATPGGSSTSGTSGGSGSTTTLNQSHLSVARGSATMSASDVATVTRTSGVADATGVLQLENVSFSGTVTQQQSGSSTGTGTTGGAQSGGTGGSTSAGSSGTSGRTGGFGGFGGGNFSVDQTTVEGVPVTGTIVGPLTSTASTSGRSFTSADSGKDVAVLDSSYAKTASKKVGDTITLGGSTFTVIGIVASTDSSSTTASNVYIPLDTAQKLSSETGKVTTIYVAASSSANVDTIKSALERKLSGTTVSTEADLASSVSGSLGTASALVSSLGTWLSIAVLAAAFLIAILFTISGVTRRTREFGTLKAIGWSNARITRQVAGESIVQGIIGGFIGVLVGVGAVVVINLIRPTISAAASASRGGATGGGPGAAPSGAPGAGGAGGFSGAGAFGAARRAAAATSDVVLHAPLTVDIILVAIALAILGGVLAGVLGGWRASRLRPAEALRSVA
ncbi:ABC transporter permease [Curtobacterium ammoniigenes]|uniref:ABC transporter permease n=1 Tax=Curtobacterium ammoniigenes TaxID=395387 RepID=UPI0008371E8B|nr:ABC transporter permease [Curtobacterium ammoniigenes]